MYVNIFSYNFILFLIINHLSNILQKCIMNLTVEYDFNVSVAIHLKSFIFINFPKIDSISNQIHCECPMIFWFHVRTRIPSHKYGYIRIWRNFYIYLSNFKLDLRVITFFLFYFCFFLLHTYYALEKITHLYPSTL